MLTLTEWVFKQNYTVTLITPHIDIIVFQMKLIDTDLGETEEFKIKTDSTIISVSEITERRT